MTTVAGDVGLYGLYVTTGLCCLARTHTHSRRRTPHSNKVQRTRRALSVVASSCRGVSSPGPVTSRVTSFHFLPLLKPSGEWDTLTALLWFPWLLNAPVDDPLLLRSSAASVLFRVFISICNHGEERHTPPVFVRCVLIPRS